MELTALEHKFLLNLMNKIVEAYKGKESIKFTSKQTGLGASFSYKSAMGLYYILENAGPNRLSNYKLKLGRRNLRIIEMLSKFVVANLAQQVLPEYDRRVRATVDPLIRSHLGVYLFRAKERLESATSVANKVSRELSV